MEPRDFKSIRDKFGLSVVDWARVLGYDGKRDSVQRTILNYESGRRDIPGYISSLAIMYERYGIPADFAADSGLIMNNEDMEP